MSASSYPEAWESYRAAVRELYRAPQAAALESERSAGQVYAEKLDQGGEAVVERAAGLRQALQPAVLSEDLDTRELAGLKLLAAAALDLSVAGDLLEMEAEEPDAAVERSAGSALLTARELVEVLEAPLEGGLSGLLETERSVLPLDPAAARQKLAEVCLDFLRTIPEQAADLSQKAVVGVANLGLGPAQMVASVAVQELGAMIPDGLSIIGKKAAALALEAIQKLRASLGEAQEQEIRKQAQGWFEQIQEKREAVASLLDKLYGTESLGQEVQVSVGAAPDSLQAAAFNSATKRLEELLGRYAKTKSTLDRVMTVLSLVKPALLPSVPWGPVVLYTSYLGLIGYSVFSGADYLDSPRFGQQNWLDRVQGLRSTVTKSLAPAPEETPPAAAGG